MDSALFLLPTGENVRFFLPSLLKKHFDLSENFPSPSFPPRPLRRERENKSLGKRNAPRKRNQPWKCYELQKRFFIRGTFFPSSGVQIQFSVMSALVSRISKSFWREVTKGSPFLLPRLQPLRRSNGRVFTKVGERRRRRRRSGDAVWLDFLCECDARQGRGGCSKWRTKAQTEKNNQISMKYMFP